MEVSGIVKDLKITKKPFELIHEGFYTYSGSFLIKTDNGDTIEIVVDGVTKEINLAKGDKVKVEGDLFELTSDSKKETKVYAKSITLVEKKIKYTLNKYRSQLYSALLLLAIFSLVISVYPIFGTQVAFSADIFSYVLFGLALLLMFIDYSRIKNHSVEKLQ
ncbi:MAG: hypothetical protein ACP6IS_06440 [Candidatus Asgardarchaeia archaeon]